MNPSFVNHVDTSSPDEPLISERNKDSRSRSATRELDQDLQPQRREVQTASERNEISAKIDGESSRSQLRLRQQETSRFEIQEPSANLNKLEYSHISKSNPRS